MGIFSWLFGTPKRCGRLIGGHEFDYPVVGEGSYQKALAAITGGKTEDGVQIYCVAHLVPEPRNKYDPNAVSVIIRGQKVGYLSRDDARRMLQVLKRALCGSAATEAVVVGGWKRKRKGAPDEGHFGVRLNAALPFEIE